jgi:hypothetical protein
LAKAAKVATARFSGHRARSWKTSSRISSVVSTQFSPGLVIRQMRRQTTLQRFFGKAGSTQDEAVKERDR